MNTEVKLKVLQNIYANVLAESAFYFNHGGILDKVREEKKQNSLISGKKLVEQFNINAPEDVFLWSSEIFNCAIWEIKETEDGFLALAEGCKLCNAAKKIGDGMPCYMYCLSPMEGMIKGINLKFDFEVLETLWDGTKCRVKIRK